MGTVTVTVTDAASHTATASVSYTVGTVTAPSTLMGVSMSDEDHGLTTWDAAHCYNRGDVDTSARYAVKAVCYSDSARWTSSGNVNSASVRSDLLSIRSQRPGLKVRYSWGNEVDRHVSDFALFDRNLAALETVVDAMDADVWLGVSFTGNCFRTPSTIDKFTTAAQRLTKPKRFLAFNPYPPGRQKNPPEKTPFSMFLDPPLQWAHDHGIAYVAGWETGTPMSPNYDRPTYMADLRDYLLEKAAALGLTVTELCYWDQSIGIDNRLYHDAPLTARAWTTFA